MATETYTSLDEAVKGCFGREVSIEKSSGHVSGDISSTYRLDLTNGKKVLLKTNAVRMSDMFDAEAAGLDAIADTGTIRTPELFGKGIDESRGFSFLMMEMIETGRAGEDGWQRLGHAFADMHLADASRFVSGGRYGFFRDNYIGATKQINTPKDSWVDFFRQCRLEPQFKMAENAFSDTEKRAMISLLDRLGDRLEGDARPSLLHGDMWGGNHLIDVSGDPVLIDPAAYVGHSEADLAMTELFSPMPRAFYAAYHEKIPPDSGYSDRKPLYNLYHILNHYNLFGGGYIRSAANIIMRYGG